MCAIFKAGCLSWSGWLKKVMHDAIVLFSGGLDSILAAKLLLKQGLRILCAHFTSPFFGDATKVEHWRKIHNLDVEAFDCGEEFVAMLANGPENGFGKHLNPCVDCKILLLRKARKLMEERGARFIATGEVVGQRPMSQRYDSLHLIQKKSGVKGLVLRPLCAHRLEPIPVEEEGFVKRQKLLGISGRGRDEQLTLAKEFGLKELPSPGGGCLLTEKENARRYWQILAGYNKAPDGDMKKLAHDFYLCRIGRQYFHPDGYRLCVGRNKMDNDQLAALAQPEDILIRLAYMAGPTGLARNGWTWPEEVLSQACSLTASHSPQALALDSPMRINAGKKIFSVLPRRLDWNPHKWDAAREEIRAFYKNISRKN